MADFGIVCEFNPLHLGHEYLFKCAESQGADNIICVMSGNAVQRGELAMMDKYKRARAALDCGADLVLELPFPWCAASAEYFAEAATYILSFFSDTVFFGSESGQIEPIVRAARICESKEFSEKYCERLGRGEGAASAFAELLGEQGFSNLGSNDLLGISYVRSILRNNYDMKVRTVKRMGTGYNSTSVEEGEFPSASAVRKMISNEDISSAFDLLPEDSARVLREAIECGEISDASSFVNAAHFFFRLHRGEDFMSVAEIGGGLANRICAAAQASSDGEKFFENIKTKVYTNARIRRAMLYCMTGVGEVMMRSLPKYTTVLAANERGRAILAKNKKSGGLTVITKPADAPSDSEQYVLSERLDSIFTFCLKNKSTSGELLKKSAYIR